MTNAVVVYDNNDLELGDFFVLVWTLWMNCLKNQV